ncbi:MAG: 2-keto-4-pentenoate hydratase [Glycocaulis sp.]
MARSSNIEAISAAFVTARGDGAAVRDFPGTLPETLAEAYAVQDRSIAAWGDRVAGWKIGMIPPGFRAQAGAERLAGPIFARQVITDRPGLVHDMPVFAGGFAAVEAEFVFRLKSGLDPAAPVTPESVSDIVAALHVGVEIASSPFAGINDLGPMSVVSDFGNNNGLIVGAEIADWRSVEPESLPARVDIDGVTVGEASAGAIPGGPLGALCFLVELCRARGIALKEGDYISTGAATGVHEAAIGAQSIADFGPHGQIALRLVAAEGAVPAKVTA